MTDGVDECSMVLVEVDVVEVEEDWCRHVVWNGEVDVDVLAVRSVLKKEYALS